MCLPMSHATSLSIKKLQKQNIYQISLGFFLIANHVIFIIITILGENSINPFYSLFLSTTFLEKSTLIQIMAFQNDLIR